jgi:hypothetical protein
VHAMNSFQNEIKKSPAKRANILLRLLGPGSSYLMPAKKDQAPPDLRYFTQSRK